MQHLGLIVIGAAFWIFLTAATLSGVIADYKKRRLELEPLRAAIERGQQLDPAIVEHLMTRRQPDQPVRPTELRIGGILTVAAGVGVALLSWFIRTLLPQAELPVVGVGVLAVCVGIGLLVAAASLERQLPAGGARDTHIGGSGA